ncbi:MAG: hypothetical protein IPN23_07585 [Elusimicrobia bacterium]|nr:hypothetical protein [Elusimicrobiota bacterium]
MLTRFGERAGAPVLLNTSFERCGSPSSTTTKTP